MANKYTEYLDESWAQSHNCSNCGYAEQNVFFKGSPCHSCTKESAYDSNWISKEEYEAEQVILNKSW